MRRVVVAAISLLSCGCGLSFGEVREHIAGFTGTTGADSDSEEATTQASEEDSDTETSGYEPGPYDTVTTNIADTDADTECGDAGGVDADTGGVHPLRIEVACIIADECSLDLNHAPLTNAQGPSFCCESNHPPQTSSRRFQASLDSSRIEQLIRVL